MASSRCDDCGAATTDVTCNELFDRLLALDHSRSQPWGALHGEAVACFFLQHPNAPRAPLETDPLYQRLERFVGDGERSSSRTTATIHSLAVDGSFPASDYHERLLRWAQWILARRHDGCSRTT